MKDELKPIIDFSGYCKDEYLLELGDYKLEERDGRLYAVKRQPQYQYYPRTYEECCKILNINPSYDIRGLEEKEEDLYFNFIDLIRCRDAYWKIADDWKEKRKGKAMHYVIYSTLSGEVVRDKTPNCIANYLLDFPTEEIRDTFFENFKDLIKFCKGLL